MLQIVAAMKPVKKYKTKKRKVWFWVRGHYKKPSNPYCTKKRVWVKEHKRTRSCWKL